MAKMLKKIIVPESRLFDVEARTARFVISTEARDRHGTIIKQDGWEIKNYNACPTVLYGHKAHSDDPDNVIGTGRVWVEDGKLWGEVTFETEDVNPKSEKIFKKIQVGTLRATSVGFKPLEYRWGASAHNEDPEDFYYVRQELLEFSIVPIPSNPETLLRESRSIENELMTAVFKEKNNDDDRLLKFKVIRNQLANTL